MFFFAIAIIQLEFIGSARSLLAGVPFFFKQWGGANKKKAGRVLEGRTWDEMPRGMQVARA